MNRRTLDCHFDLDSFYNKVYRNKSFYQRDIYIWAERIVNIYNALCSPSKKSFQFGCNIFPSPGADRWFSQDVFSGVKGTLEAEGSGDEFDPETDVHKDDEVPELSDDDLPQMPLSDKQKLGVTFVDLKRLNPKMDVFWRPKLSFQLPT